MLTAAAFLFASLPWASIPVAIVLASLQPDHRTVAGVESIAGRKTGGVK